jgi:hypothetical protein
VRKTLRRQKGPTAYKEFTAKNEALHAEPVVLHKLLAKLPNVSAEKDKLAFLPVCRLQLDVTRSPCPA